MLHHRVFGQIAENHSHCQYDYNTWRSGTEDCRQCTFYFTYAVTYEGGCIYGKGPGKAVGKGNGIEEFLVVHPAFGFRHFFLYYRQHGVAAAYCKQSYFKEDCKDFQKSFQFFLLCYSINVPLRAVLFNFTLKMCIYQVNIR